MSSSKLSGASLAADGAGAAALGSGVAQPVPGSPAVVVVDSVGETIGGASQRM